MKRNRPQCQALFCGLCGSVAPYLVAMSSCMQRIPGDRQASQPTARLSTPWPISSRRWLACNIGLRLHRLGSQIRRHHPTTSAWLTVIYILRDPSIECTLALQLPQPQRALRRNPPVIVRARMSGHVSPSTGHVVVVVVVVRGWGLHAHLPFHRPTVQSLVCRR